MRPYQRFLRRVVVLFALLPAFAEGTMVYGKGGTSANKFYDHLSYLYPFFRDSVAIDWQGIAVLQSIELYQAGLIDFIMVDSKLTEPMVDAGFYGLPMVGSALVMVYNLPSLSNNTQLVLDGETLALIWCGNISRWNDARVAALNEDANLPDAPIYLIYYPGQTPGTVLLLKDALSNYSSLFAEELVAADGLFENMKPTLNGYGTSTLSNPARLDYVRNTTYSMTYYWLEDVLGTDLRYAAMKNKAGNVVQPSTQTVQSSMNDFNDLVEAGHLDTPLYNGPGNDSWPIPFITFLALFQHIQTTDCMSIKELLDFIAWTQVNDQASSAMSAMGYMPLAFGYRSRLIDMLGQVTCNGHQALLTAYLLGVGAGLPVYTDWSLSYSSMETYIKIYTEYHRPALEQITAGVVDFEMSTTPPTSSQLERAPDLLSVPLAATAIVPAYHIPSIYPNQSLVLSLQLLSDIFLNKVIAWNDTSIAALNPGLVLPDLDILIVYDNRSSSNSIWINALRQAVSEFADTVQPDDAMTSLPVFVEAPERIRNSGSMTLGSAMMMYNGSFAMGDLYAVRSVRGLPVGQLLNSANQLLTVDQASIIAALNGPARSAEAWPMVRVHRLYMRSATMPDCMKAQAVADWVYWTQKSAAAAVSAMRNWAAVPSHAQSGDLLLASFLSSVTCDGKHVSSVYRCIYNNASFCNNRGKCTNGKCQCKSGWTGAQCQLLADDSHSDSTATVLGAVLGSVVPAGLLLVLLLTCAVLVAVRTSRRKERNEWEMDFAELEMGEPLGAGGYGIVHKAKWRGTEVAVKTIAAKNITKDMERAFREEVRVMTALRHPNVVLFMGASTSLPNLCIVMEFMTLGSLFDLLHNELIVDLPFALKARMAYQTAKGMHFLHSSGIVHNDLKSMNLLLDSKWNVKVSDFGLTKFRAEMTHRNGAVAVGTVHWSAPEILAGSADVDEIDRALTDVYAFGIILWEILTREAPYHGLSPAGVAVAVLRDDLRPPLPATCPPLHDPDYLALLQSCWHRDPSIRPTFLEIMTRLAAMSDVESAAPKGSSSSSPPSSDVEGAASKRVCQSWTLPSTSSESHSSGPQYGSDDDDDDDDDDHHHDDDRHSGQPPYGTMAIVFSDVARAASLWQFRPEAMRQATVLHNDLLRGLLAKHRGYEVRSNANLAAETSGEVGTFCMAFQRPLDALGWCIDVQRELVGLDWPEELLEHPGAAEERGDVDDRVLFRGLRVRMGAHFGEPRRARDPMTRRTDFYGPVVHAAARITAVTHGGQVVLSQAMFDQVVKDSDPAHEKDRFVCLGKFEMPDDAPSGDAYELKVENLKARFFGGVMSGSKRRDTRPGGREGDMMRTGTGEEEDSFLTSANLCRWVIDYREIALGEQVVGMGSYGVVYRGRWKGVDVAVKRFINQRLDERRMLEFRSEMAFLSALHHPNIVLFIGACMKRPNICIVTEFVASGSLAEILSDASIKLEWRQRLKMLRGAAAGVNYLHSLRPCTVHGDLKSSNLLVDENMNIKVADFGFARIKEDHATMTRCGAPCWTAPEIIRGERHSEKADVYGFGMVMWEVVTRKQPFAGRNFMGVSLDVLEGRRPQIPDECPRDIRKMIRKCWHGEAAKRPTMEAVVGFLDDLVGQDGAEHDYA